MTDTKTCANEACGKTYEKRPRESNPSFTARRYCSLNCVHEINRARTAPAGTRTCTFCGEPYEKRKRESLNEFQGRLYCSLDCRYRGDKTGRRRVLPRRTTALVEVVREPGQPWRPAGFTPEPNVYGATRQGC